MAPNPAIDIANKNVIASVEEQIRELQPSLQKQVEIATIEAELKHLKILVDSSPLVDALKQGLTNAISTTSDIRAGTKSLADFGEVLLNLYSFQQALQTGLEVQQITDLDKEKFEDILLSGIKQVRQILNYRPDVGAIMDDLTAMKNLRGGPADATAFHDFQVLQLAFKSVWMHAFNQDFKDRVTHLFEETVRLYDEAGLTVPNFDAINDINDLSNFIYEIKKLTDPNFEGIVSVPPSLDVMTYFPEAVMIWNLFSDSQKFIINDNADRYRVAKENFGGDLNKYKETIFYNVNHPQGYASRLTRLISEIGNYLNEPYAFDVFAPNSYNYGLMITYRQKWEPGAYQAGDLVATIPLAPGETRKFTKKRVVKTSRAEKELEKSMSSRSSQFSEVSRAEAEIIEKVTTATNFKMTAHGSFNISVGSVDVTSDFGVNQDVQSSMNKKAFHEATIKASEEYRQERSLEIDTTTSGEIEETSTGEISNPNNEITVTYLFYELQRRFKIHEFLYRVCPVILVAQDVPAPHEIDEAWLIQYQWILSRVLLDDSLRPALNYLTSGFAGDEASISIIKAHWEAQVGLVRDLEGKVKSQLVMRDVLRGGLESREMQKALADADQTTAGADIAKTILTGGGLISALTGGVSTFFNIDSGANNLEDATANATKAEANRKAAETRLQYAEQALADAQDKLKQATGGFEQATKEYAAALQNKFARHVSIDQLRIHVKQNILYYMQAIWDHEPPDQRFFRLYHQMVGCPQPDPKCQPKVVKCDPLGNGVEFTTCPPVTMGPQVQLIEIADLDNPLGYKGNYIIFPLKGECYLTKYMLTEFIDNYLGLLDPDGGDNFDAETFDDIWSATKKNLDNAIKDKDDAKQKQFQSDLDDLKKKLTEYINSVRRTTDEIIVPTGQLFIEALPGSHPLLEDFKLLHRAEDVRKVKAEVRHAELENLRLASRLVGGQDDPKLLDDPDIDKKIVVEGNVGAVVP